MSVNLQKIKLLTNVTQRYVFSKITFEILSAMPQSQNSIGNWPFLRVEILNMTKTSKKA